jgi:CarD family transcriptional regulator
MFRVGSTVFYPGCGPCCVAGIATRAAGREAALFYHLVMLGDHGDVFVPVDKARALGLRALVTKAEVPRLLDRLRRTAGPPADWRKRTRENQRLLASGSASDHAEIVTSLAVLSDKHELSYGDRRTLVRARALLIDEISKVTGATRTAAEEQIDRSLDERREVEGVGVSTMAGRN